MVNAYPSSPTGLPRMVNRKGCEVRTTWTKEQKQDFKEWHSDLLQRLCYPAQVQRELAAACAQWLSTIPGDAKC